MQPAWFLAGQVLNNNYGNLCELGFPDCLRSGRLSWSDWWVSFAPEFQCCYFCESSCLFNLSYNSDIYVSKLIYL